MKADFRHHEGERGYWLREGRKRIMRRTREEERRSTSVSGFFRIVNKPKIKVL